MPSMNPFMTFVERKEEYKLLPENVLIRREERY